MSEQCEHGNIGLCGLCILGVQKSSKANVISISKAAAHREHKQRIPKSFPARFDSECPVCFDDIFEGDDITGSDSGWIHADCWDDE